MLRHLRGHGKSAHQCRICGASFSRPDILKKHMESHTRKRRTTDNGEEPKRKKEEGRCNWCNQTKELCCGKPYCKTCEEKGKPCKWCHRPMPEKYYELSSDTCNSCTKKKDDKGASSALNGTVTQYDINTKEENKMDLIRFLTTNEATIKSNLQDEIQKHSNIKWYLTLKVKFVKYDKDGEEMSSEPVFRTRPTILMNSDDMDTSHHYEDVKKMENYLREGSGWRLDFIIMMQLNSVPYKPVQGSNYIPTPKYIADKKAVINIQNTDNKCFLWSILAALHPILDNPQRVTHYQPYEDEMNVNGITFPVVRDQIPKFEKQNDISINVFSYDGEWSHYYLARHTSDKEVNLLLISKGEVKHYCLIKNMSRLLGDRTKYNGVTYYCHYCFHGFVREDLLEEHRNYCKHHGGQIVKLPTEDDNILKFKNFQHQLPVPFIIYADFESVTCKIDTCDNDLHTSSTVKYQKHEPCSFGYKIVSMESKYCKPTVIYRGPNVINHFIESLMEEGKEIQHILSNIQPMNLSAEEELSFEKAEMCHICNQLLGADRVRDHCHLTGRFRGAAHNACNINCKYQTEQGQFFIPVVIHNLRGYDSHLIMNAIGKQQSKINCIPNTMEKYISFSIGHLRFIDSLQFLNASLEKLTMNLAQDGPDTFIHLSKHFPNDIDLLLRKGIYPYDYMDNEEKFNENSLPPMTCFYSQLTEQPISTEDYEHAENIWQRFNMKTLGDYHDLYLKTDVLLLADVFENFRTVCLNMYNLDPAHYYTAPGLFWDAMLKMTKIELELFTDPDMHLFIENNMRGGISMVSNRYSKANNKYLKDYNIDEESTYIVPLDANNLYGWAMSEPQPCSEFEWLNNEQIDKFDITQIPDETETGYILEVNLDYPPELHNLHSDYPLAPESTLITEDQLSPYQISLLHDLNMKPGTTKKLVPNLHNKSKYVTHYRNLQLYIKYGLKITKIHRILQFKQRPWMKPYITFNTKHRKIAKNSFEKDFFKLANNSVFGRTMMNVRKHCDVKLVTEEKKLKKWTSKPSYKQHRIFNNDLVAVELIKSTVKLYQPIYVGFSVLELSKTLMYDFHYGLIKPKYASNAKLLFTDTDSLTYEIKTGDVYTDMKEDIHLYDTSEYPIDHPLYSIENKKVLGKMKDESFGTPLSEFVGLRPKMYSMISESEGIAKYVVKRFI